jgi:uncharacterized protein with von Willebrand factor type A (vWA) domain
VPVATQPPVHRLVAFGRFVRANGLPVGTGRVLSFCRAAAALDAFDRTDMQLAARATLVSRPEDFPALDALFARFFAAETGASGSIDDGLEHTDDDREADDGSAARGEDTVLRDALTAMEWSPAGAEDEPEGDAAIRVVASDTALLRTRDFAELTPDERSRALALIRKMAFTTPMKRSRRYRPSARGARFDLRSTLRKSLRTEGEPFRRAWRARRVRPRPLVLLLDVSGSMAPYSRPMVEFAHASAMAGRRVEVFVFGTRLTRVTRLLRERDPDAALAAVGRAVTDWEGGTRIGDSMRELLDEWSTRSALRGSVVVLCSDGLERGDPMVLAKQVARLSRLVHRLVWVNPLKGSPRYEPLARGMAAALPHVDVFLPGHNLQSLEALAGAVSAA